MIKFDNSNIEQFRKARFLASYICKNCELASLRWTSVAKTNKKLGAGREVRVYVNLETVGRFQVMIAPCKSIKKIYE